jgi:hypothetical protein
MIKVKGNKIIKYADQDYSQPGRKLMKVTDNGNGFTIKSYSWSPSWPDMYWSIGYSDAVDLLECLEAADFR